jgi:hypothetical protein
MILLMCDSTDVTAIVRGNLNSGNFIFVCLDEFENGL